jgi:ABC-type Fe3+-hydroxamate transport system substrate-binding protein
VIYELGGGDRLVGVTSMCDYPKEAQSIEKIGSYYRPSMEKIVSLKPDYVFGMIEGANASVRDRLDVFGIENQFYSSENLDDVLFLINDIAEKLGLSSDKLVRKVKGVFSKRPDVKGRGIMVINIDPVIAIGGGVFINDILRCGGFENILQNNPTKYPRISIEAIYKLKPDYILYSKMDSVTGIETLKEKLDKIGVKSQYLPLNPDIFNRASYRIADACLFLRENIR